MARFYKKRDKTIGQPPGALTFIGNQKMDHPRIRLIDYSRDSIIEKELLTIKEGNDYVRNKTITWINIDGLHDLNLIKDAGDTFDLHPLLLEDLLNTGQRPKMDDFDQCLFMTLKLLEYNPERDRVTSDQLSMIVGKTYVLTFQEMTANWFDPVRNRIRKPSSRIRALGADYLAYAIIDTVVDNYVLIIEQIGEQVEALEDALLENADASVMEEINHLKKEMLYLRKTIRPAREAIVHLTKAESHLVQDATVPFLRDLLDIITQATEAIDIYLEMLSDHMSIYTSIVSNRMNDIMKVLTVFAAIFIPLTFIAGVYGTNFKYLPELEFRYSYFIFWGVLICVALTMIGYFKRRKWI